MQKLFISTILHSHNIIICFYSQSINSSSYVILLEGLVSIIFIYALPPRILPVNANTAASITIVAYTITHISSGIMPA